MQFDFSGQEPIYLQVANQIEEGIFTGAFKEETQVPSTTEMSREFHINPATVLKGINILVNEKLVEKRRGLGMFVCKGAYDLILEKRKGAFFEDYVRKIVSEAKNLKLTEVDLVQLIKRGFQANED
ncbi:GntR family transcriptional regulator [Pediococcus inopinatus]|uniref:GntR family transcriptional regulator n=1 Tax=Pediococcus inopinatus TaxID=114090 RepID=A0ABZ0Q2L2_9LACO|nr:GntR family transcriptional regulator [Pediococcus inopinatus]AVL00292.1 GntR family transcriptional regulator [Pediococcus inopinatus]WPC17953.1 GntR family transcriptional regulator [Pediococcus inopinatus]WPC19503.1 GntR family transcriptional regulator [Pediococcus inopinatus]WPC21203.1 GntR family transcriptional regulator [Pediococcus inopinatus]WPP09870.1 GntR family transcriptional regulator [Pediococcus inopinatus]